MIEKVRTNIGGYSNIHYEVVNSEELPYEDERFDIVIANMMLYHIPNLDKALSEIRRVLKRMEYSTLLRMAKMVLNHSSIRC